MITKTKLFEVSISLWDEHFTFTTKFANSHVAVSSVLGDADQVMLGSDALHRKRSTCYDYSAVGSLKVFVRFM